jgi:hypothetical protein
VNFPLDEALEGNLILIGGPVYNRVHRLILERLDLPYEFRDRVLVRTEDGKTASSYGWMSWTTAMSAASRSSTPPCLPRPRLGPPAAAPDPQLEEIPRTVGWCVSESPRG